MSATEDFSDIAARLKQLEQEKPSVKVVFPADGQESGWLPIETMHVGRYATFSLQIDGRRLAETIITALDKLYEG
jgi:hypothetical protein